MYVDVVVRDASGHIVHGLRESDFHLSEDKHSQQVRFFAEHTSATPSVPHPAVANPPGTYSNLPTDPGDGSLNIILLDLLNTDRSDQTFARERLLQFLRKLPPGKQVALFLLANRLEMVQDATTDSDALARAAEQISLQQLNRTLSANQRVRDTDTLATLPGTLAGAVRAEVTREDIHNMKVKIEATGEAFRELGQAVTGLPGRKNLFWIAGQFPSAEFFALPALTSSAGAGPSGVGGYNPSDFARLALAAGTDRVLTDTQIAVYPISVLGVETDSIDASQTGAGTVGQSQSMDTASSQFQNRVVNRSVMTHIADETGGEAFFGNNDVDSMLRRGLEDSENYYTLAYSPTDHDWNSKYRTIQVQLPGHGASLSYRRGYVAVPEQPAGNTLQEFQIAMQVGSPPATMLRLRAVPTARAGNLELASTLDIGGVGFTDAAEGKRSAHLVVGLVAYPYPPSAGAKATQTQGKLDLNLSPAQYTALLSDGVHLPQQLPLPAGKYLLRLGVLDQGSGRIGTLTIPVAMP